MNAKRKSDEPVVLATSANQGAAEAPAESAEDRRTFRRLILRTGLLVEVAKRPKSPGVQAAKLYRFDKAKYRWLAELGIGRKGVRII